MSTVNLIDVPGQLQERVSVLGAALAQWSQRDDSKPQAGVRQAANTAMDEIDAMLADLHRARQALMNETRVSDDARAARVDAMLAERSR